MKWTWFTRLVIFLFLSNTVISLSAQNVELTTQAEVDAFTGTSVNGYLLIKGDNITSLAKLSSLDTVTGAVFIEYNRKLKSLTGLDSILYIGHHLQIESNTELDSINAFGLLKEIGGPLVVRNNFLLKDCCAFYPLITGTQGVIKGAVFISGNKGCKSEKELRENCDSDSDKDGKDDTEDACPNDPNKIQPGICGCGVAETDSDNDGTPDCKDQCPNDPSKVITGNCGCGTADKDSDNDGTPDCEDECPYNPAITKIGICGCENPRIVDINIANVSACDDNGTAAASDDTYTVDVTIIFERAPTSGTLLITGGTNGVLYLSTLATASSHTIYGLPFVANGKLIEVIATFAGNRDCTKRRVFGTFGAKSCSTEACDPPNDITVDTENYLNGALVSWTALGEGVEYELDYRPTGMTNWATKSVQSNQLLISDLSDYTTYDYRIRSLCDGTTKSTYTTGQFTTGGKECELTSATVQNVDCQNNGTPYDSADDYLSFDLYVTGINVGNGFSINNVDGDNTGQYNTINSYRTATGSFGNGDLIITVTDDSDGNCQLTTILTEPKTCDDDCRINSVSIDAVTLCNDRRSLWTVNDDFIIADIAVHFKNPPKTGSLRLQYGRFFFQRALVSNLQNTNSYIFKRIELPATGKDFTLTAFFTQEKECKYIADYAGILINEDKLCENECNILDAKVSNVHCVDNNTADISDDYLTFELMVRSINSNTSYRVSNVVGVDTGLYHQASLFRTNVGTTEAAINLIITDSNDPNCNYTLSLDNKCMESLSATNFTTNSVRSVNTLKVYPNPAKETLLLDYPTTKTTPLVEIFDLLGQKVMSQKMEGNQLNIGHLDKGLYHLVLRDGQEFQTKKFIKE